MEFPFELARVLYRLLREAFVRHLAGILWWKTGKFKLAQVQIARKIHCYYSPGRVSFVPIYECLRFREGVFLFGSVRKLTYQEQYCISSLRLWNTFIFLIHQFQNEQVSIYFANCWFRYLVWNLDQKCTPISYRPQSKWANFSPTNFIY